MSATREGYAGRADGLAGSAERRCAACVAHQNAARSEWKLVSPMPEGKMCHSCGRRSQTPSEAPPRSLRSGHAW